MLNNENSARYQQEDEQLVLNQKNPSYQTNFFNIPKLNQQMNGILAISILIMKYTLPALLLIGLLPHDDQILIQIEGKKIIQYSYIFYITLVVNKIIIAFLLIALYQQSASKLSVLRIVMPLKSYLRLLTEIDYYLSNTTAVFTLQIIPNIISCTISLSISIITCIYLEDYLHIQNFFYSSSCKLNFVFRLITLFGFIIALLQRIEVSNIVVNTLIANYGILTCIWFYKSGYQTYPHFTAKLDTTVFISFIFSFFALKIQQVLGGESKNGLQLFIKLSLSLVIILICNFAITQYKSKITRESGENIKQFVDNILINNTQPVLIYGRAQRHRSVCKSQTCEPNSDCRIASLQQQILRGYVRCLYQSQIETERQKDQYLLYYCQYLFSQVPISPYKISQELSKICAQKLSIFNKNCYYQLKKDIKQIFINNMSNLYEGQLQFEQLLNFEHSCQVIYKNINKLANKNIQIFEKLSHHHIDFNAIFEQIKHNQLIERRTNRQWAQIINHYKHRKLIRGIYLLYRQLIKNEYLSQKVISDFNFNKCQQFTRQELSIKQTQKDYSSSTVFQRQTIVFTSKMKEQRLIFKNISNNFTHLLSYRSQEVVGSSIEIILEGQLKQTHQVSFLKWFENSMIAQNNDGSYQQKNALCITKYNQPVEVKKYFKCFLDFASSLQFVCMLRLKNQKNNQISRIMSNIEKDQAKLDQYLLQIRNQQAIFIKEQQNQPKTQLSNVLIIKLMLLLYFIFMAITIVSFHFLTVDRSVKLQSYSEQYITFMQCYRIPMILGNSYLSYFLNVGNKTKIASQIANLRERFIALQSTKVVIQTLYDKNINTVSNYFPYRNNPLNHSFDQIQIFYTISNTISSIMTPVDKNSFDLKVFDQFITPAYHNMLNNTKRKFHQSFVTFIDSIKNMQIIIIALQGCLSLLFILLVLVQVKSFGQKINSIPTVIANFSQEDIKIIKKYWVKSQKIFASLFEEYLGPVLQVNLQKKCEPKEIGSNGHMNRLFKKLGKNNTISRKIKLIFLTTTLVAIPFVSSIIGTQSSQQSQLSYLIYFQNEGHLFLKFFPTATIVGYGCLSKYYSISYPQQVQFDSSRFQQMLNAMKLVGEFPFIPEVKQQHSIYFSKQKHYFFGNPCTYNQKVIDSIGVSIQECENILNNSFPDGLTNYMRVAHSLAKQYMSGSKYFTAIELEQFSKSVTILSAYILDAISSWGIEYKIHLTRLVQKQNIFTILNLLALASIATTFILILIRSLGREYSLYRYAFMKMIPQYLLKKDKVVRQILVNANILA